MSKEFEAYVAYCQHKNSAKTHQIIISAKNIGEALVIFRQICPNEKLCLLHMLIDNTMRG